MALQTTTGAFGGMLTSGTGPNGGVGGKFQGANGGRAIGGVGPGGSAGALAQGPNGRIGGVGYIPGVGFGIGGVNPANGNRGGLVITADGVAVKGNVNGQAFQNSWSF